MRTRTHSPLLLSLAGLLLALGATLPAVAGPSDTSEELGQLMADVWAMRMQASPYDATQNGIRDYNGLHPDLSPEGIARKQADEREALARLDAIDPQSLSPGDRINAELLRWLLHDGAGTFQTGVGTRAHAFRIQHMPLNTLFEGPQQFAFTLATTPFETAEDFENYLHRLRGLEATIGQTIDQLRAGLESGWTVPAPAIRVVAEQTRASLVETPEDHPLWKPFSSFPDTIDSGDQARLAREAREILVASVVPAYARFLGFLENDYLPNTRSSIAATALPEGEAYYAYCIRQHTTTSLTAEEIHQIGLAEVERLRGAMSAILEEVGFEGDFAAFGESLRNDSRFRFTTGDESLDAHRAFAKRIDPMMTRLFGKLPRAPYGVEPMPESAARAGGSPYYKPPSSDGLRPGNFFVNTLRPELQPKYTLPSLVAHEAVPGHHMQFAIANELGELPEFRQKAYYTGFSEGWALYSESLGDEVGMYTTPYERYGRLASEMRRSVRLVVDTGMHAKGWSREKAIDFFAANTPDPRPRIEAEIDRYIAWPGQALAYKIGQLKISALRQRAEEALGDAFDLRAFHDEILRRGSLPLEVLDRLIEQWIAEQQPSS